MKDILIRLLSNLRKSAKSADHLFFFFFCAVCSAVAEEPFFKKNDVIALVGGEDMVAMSEYGYLELLLQRALPDYHLKFRDLAWEGDTVFEQHRDLNFPPLEAQLDQVGATVVICQFGQMESLGKGGTRNAERGTETVKDEVAKFIAAYEKLVDRMSGEGKRRVVLIEPFAFSQSVPFTPEQERAVDATVHLRSHNAALADFSGAITELTGVPGLEKIGRRYLPIGNLGADDVLLQRDGVHLNETGHRLFAWETILHLGLSGSVTPRDSDFRDDPLCKLIIAKNRLWFNYWRVQNWAFLAGDRTEQPSSRDWRDPSKRWFPAEREKFLPLIEAKEQEIWALAAKLAQP